MANTSSSSKDYISADVRADVMYKFTCCAACGTFDANECGHLLAEAKGGKPTLDNLVRLCSHCNRKQGTATVKFKSYAQAPDMRATYAEAIDLINRRRVAWAKYCSHARSDIKIKPYKPL